MNASAEKSGRIAAVMRPAAPSLRVLLDEAEAQIRVAESPYANAPQRLERHLWAAYLASKHTQENPVSMRVVRILRRSAQGFLAAWREAPASGGESRIFFVGGERFIVQRPAATGEVQRFLRWSFDESAAEGRRSILATLAPRADKAEPERPSDAAGSFEHEAPPSAA